MIGVSKTFGGSSILSSPAHRTAGTLEKSGVPVFSIPPEEKLDFYNYLTDYYGDDARKDDLKELLP